MNYALEEHLHELWTQEILKVGFELFLAEVNLVAAIGRSNREQRVLTVHLVDGDTFVEESLCLSCEVCLQALSLAAGDDDGFVSTPP